LIRFNPPNLVPNFWDNSKFVVFWSRCEIQIAIIVWCPMMMENGNMTMSSIQTFELIYEIWRNNVFIWFKRKHVIVVKKLKKIERFHTFLLIAFFIKHNN
jgi:hypothetical protein